MKITFLGTAGSLMAENRGYPAILINDDLLLDCGEGTTQKLIQLKSIDKLRIICLTHLHNDHFMGLFSLLWHLWIYKRRKKLEIIGPVGIKYTIETILDLINTPEHMKSFQIEFTELENSDKIHLLKEKYTLESAHVEHGIPALAYRIEESGRSICYTGDSKPTKNLERLAKNCDLLISEATLPSKFADFAHTHFHMTPEDAASLALKASCKRLALFHISSYFLDQLNNFKIEAKKIFNNEVILAEDLMKLDV